VRIVALSLSLAVILAPGPPARPGSSSSGRGSDHRETGRRASGGRLAVGVLDIPSSDVAVLTPEEGRLKDGRVTPWHASERSRQGGDRGGRITGRTEALGLYGPMQPAALAPRSWSGTTLRHQRDRPSGYGRRSSAATSDLPVDERLSGCAATPGARGRRRAARAASIRCLSRSSPDQDSGQGCQRPADGGQCGAPIGRVGALDGTASGEARGGGGGGEPTSIATPTRRPGRWVGVTQGNSSFYLDFIDRRLRHHEHLVFNGGSDQGAGDRRDRGLAAGYRRPRGAVKSFARGSATCRARRSVDPVGTAALVGFLIAGSAAWSCSSTGVARPARSGSHRRGRNHPSARDPGPRGDRRASLRLARRCPEAPRCPPSGGIVSRRWEPERAGRANPGTCPRANSKRRGSGDQEPQREPRGRAPHRPPNAGGRSVEPRAKALHGTGGRRTRQPALCPVGRPHLDPSSPVKHEGVS